MLQRTSHLESLRVLVAAMWLALAGCSFSNTAQHDDYVGLQTAGVTRHLEVGSKATPAKVLPPGPLRIGVSDAILIALENSVQRLEPAKTATLEDQATSIFDPVLSLPIEERVKAGKLAPTKTAASRAEVAARREALVGAKGQFKTTRIHLLRLMSPPGEGLWDRELILSDEPIAPTTEIGEVVQYVADALKHRPDLNQARLALQRGELEVVKTRNGLLPKLDLFLNLGRTG